MIVGRLMSDGYIMKTSQIGEIRNGSNDIWIPYEKKKPKHNELIYAQFVDGLGQIHLTEIKYDRYQWKKEKTLKLIAWFSLPNIYTETK